MRKELYHTYIHAIDVECYQILIYVLLQEWKQYQNHIATRKSSTMDEKEEKKFNLGNV